ncbi:hypothetical protein [Butyrivibrio sp. INlla21]|uniref:hypothetical protein n=1 Tax=Butyrivibrio sp. INlla21 TaxID=1520811 RepID=UPI0008E1B108|nr:hypothetical protein [Butyrivibrio sp. INlla21]SFV03695.1 hypothetical protein SAMN02910342_03137 [Butyrivibrio sp. INlla21]
MLQKKCAFQKIFIFFMILVFTIAIVIAFANNSKYEPIILDNSSFLLPKRITEGMKRSDGEGYVFFQSDDYQVLGVESECHTIDDTILDSINISNEDLNKIKSINSEYELMEFVDDTSGTLVDSGRTDKPSFDNYFIRYRGDDFERVVLAYKEGDKTLLEIIDTPLDDLSEKEIIKMLGNMGFRN